MSAAWVIFSGHWEYPWVCLQQQLGKLSTACVITVRKNTGLWDKIALGSTLVLCIHLLCDAGNIDWFLIYFSLCIQWASEAYFIGFPWGFSDMMNVWGLRVTFGSYGWWVLSVFAACLWFSTCKYSSYCAIEISVHRCVSSGLRPPHPTLSYCSLRLPCHHVMSDCPALHNLWCLFLFKIMCWILSRIFSLLCSISSLLDFQNWVHYGNL